MLKFARNAVLVAALFTLPSCAPDPNAINTGNPRAPQCMDSVECSESVLKIWPSCESILNCDPWFNAEQRAAALREPCTSNTCPDL